MKRNRVVILVVLLVLVMSLQAYAVPIEKGDTEIKLSKEQIELKIEEINSTYEIGEAFSENDAAFIEKYAIKAEVDTSESITYNTAPEVTDLILPGEVETTYFDETDTSSDGKVEANCEGSVFFECGVINHRFGADFTTTITDGANYVEKITNQVTCTAYGVVGSDGLIGKIYDRTLSSPQEGVSAWSIDESERFTGAVIYYYESAKAIIVYDTGSFSIN